MKSGFIQLLRLAMVVCLVFCTYRGRAQEKDSGTTYSPDFYEHCLEYLEESEEAEEEALAGQEIKHEDGAREQFERWAHFMQPRLDEKGNPPRPDILHREWMKYLAARPAALSKKTTWTYFGPTVAPDNEGGVGRINCIAVHPGNNNILWAGTPSGGLWKTTNGGQHWTTNTDNLPALGIMDIAINPKNPDTMYLATGDGYGYSIPSGNFFGGTYSIGILKSVDGGQTFDTTGFNWTLTQARQIFRIAVHPQKPWMVYVASSNGLWRSLDAGLTWKNVLAARIADMKFSPADPDIIIASANVVYYSRNAGASWSIAQGTNASTTITNYLIETTVANKAIVYLMGLNSSFPVIFKSSDTGRTFRQMGYATNTSFSSGYYASCILASPYDSNTLYCAGLNIVRSRNGGKSWKILTADNPGTTGYVHPDHRGLMFLPGSRNVLLNANDGGIWISSDTGNTWRQTAKDIQAMQFYKMATSASNTDVVFAGAQDNGINRFGGSNWDRVYWADGMTCLVNYNDPLIIYGAIQYGKLYKSNDGGGYFGQSSINPNTGLWLTPIQMDPVDPDILYFGTNKLYKSVNGGYNWTSISTGITGSIMISKIGVAPSNSQYIYAVQGADFAVNYAWVWRTSDGGKTWKNIAKGLPTGAIYISDIKVDKKDPLIVYLSLTGYRTGLKVFKTTDGGDNWTNISGTLPNIPVNCISVEGSSENGVYIGTDAGVFYRNESATDWTYYSDGLPATIVDEMQILPLTHKIRAATYGRGIWDGELAGTVVGIEKTEALQKETLLYPNPASGMLNLKLPLGYKPQIRIYNTLGAKAMEYPKEQFTTTSTTLDISSLSPGMYLINLDYGKDGVVSKKVMVR